MSMILTVNEAGLVALPESVLAIFSITGPRQIELDVQDDGVKLRLGHAVDTASSACTQALQTLSELATSCARPGWDGHGAEPVTAEAHAHARRVLQGLPARLPMPSIGAEPDGHLTLEWYRSPSRVLSLSISPGGELNYAALLGDTSRRTGTEVLGSELPHDLVELISEILAA